MSTFERQNKLSVQCSHPVHGKPVQGFCSLSYCLLTSWLKPDSTLNLRTWTVFLLKTGKWHLPRCKLAGKQITELHISDISNDWHKQVHSFSLSQLLYMCITCVSLLYHICVTLYSTLSHLYRKVLHEAVLLPAAAQRCQAFGAAAPPPGPAPQPGLPAVPAVRAAALAVPGALPSLVLPGTEGGHRHLQLQLDGK